MIFQSYYALKNRALSHDDAKLEGTGSVASMTDTMLSKLAHYC